ncbi:MAG: hypothetical protein ACR2GH_03795 [Pseudonocardia sp.]
MTRQSATGRGDGRRAEDRQIASPDRQPASPAGDRQPTHRITPPARQLGPPAVADTTTPPPAAGERQAWRDRLAETSNGLRFDRS